MSSKKCDWGNKLCRGKCIPEWQNCVEDSTPPKINSSDLKISGHVERYTDIRENFTRQLALRQEVLQQMVGFVRPEAVPPMEKLAQGMEKIRRETIDQSASFKVDLQEYGISRIADALIYGSDTAWTAVVIAGDVLTHMLFAILGDELYQDELDLSEVADALKEENILGVGNTFRKIWDEKLDLGELKSFYEEYIQLGREGILLDSKDSVSFTSSIDTTTAAIEFFQDFKATVVYGLSGNLLGMGESNWRDKFRSVFSSLARLFKGS